MNYVLLVNKNKKVKDDFSKKFKFILCKNIRDEDIYVEEKSFAAYQNLRNYLKSINIDIGIDTAYRSFEEQEQVIKTYLEKYGEDYTKNYVAEVSTSEHHTGLAIDISVKENDKYLSEKEELEKDYLFSEIHKVLHNFGFILRYGKEKEAITKYSYEPWHIRYVGVIPATIMYQNNLSLEEYLDNFSGVLVVNKNSGVTSRNVVNKISNILGIKKIGHTGTLDPLASGVLILTIGKATKLGELLTSLEKEYITTIKQGVMTDTLDVTGNIIDEKEVVDFDYDKLLRSFEKTYLQEVPKYSAVKVNGKKLYEYARENISVDIPSKMVTIKKLELLDKNEFKVKCLVSKGTYIRSLIRDMGASINSYFIMSSLVRTKQGDFSIDESYTIDDILNNDFKILSIDEVLSNYKTIVVEDELLKKINNGVKIKNIYNSDLVLFKDKNNKIIALYKEDNGYLKMFKYLK